jgi:hypothetical protein
MRKKAFIFELYTVCGSERTLRAKYSSINRNTGRTANKWRSRGYVIQLVRVSYSVNKRNGVFQMPCAVLTPSKYNPYAFA